MEYRRQNPYQVKTVLVQQASAEAVGSVETVVVPGVVADRHTRLVVRHHNFGLAEGRPVGHLEGHLENRAFAFH